jgi:hypothetical protein
MEMLRAPLEPFARAQSLALRNAAESANGGRMEEQKSAEKRRKKIAQERAQLTTAIYQIEELVL